MDSRKLLKNKILKIEESLDEAYELVDIGYVKEVNDEVELKLFDIMKMVSEIRYLLREKLCRLVINGSQVFF